MLDAAFFIHTLHGQNIVWMFSILSKHTKGILHMCVKINFVLATVRSLFMPSMVELWFRCFEYYSYILYLGFYVAFNTVQVISRRVVGRAEETSTYSSLGLCTVNCRPTASNYQLSHLRPSRGSNPGLRGGNIHTEVAIHSINAYEWCWGKSLTHLMKFHPLQWEVAKVISLMNSKMTLTVLNLH